MSLDMLFASPVYTADIGADIVPKDVVDKLRSKDLSNPWHDTSKTTFKYDKSCNLIEEFGLVSFEKKLVDELANYLIAVGISGSIDLCLHNVLSDMT
jgi:hypothetical protein